MIKLSDYVLQFLVQREVRHVFLLTGGGAMHLNDSLGRTPEIEYFCCLHEQAAAIAAEAYGKITNRPGVVMVTTGPGGTNAITGIAGAWLDSTPCLVISGQVKRADLKGSSGVRQIGVQELDIVNIVKPITKYAELVIDPTTIAYHLGKAFHLATTGRPGPVWIDIPLDVQASLIDADALPPFVLEAEPPSAVLAGQAESVLALLREAERPILLAGNGVRLANGVDEFHRVVKLLGIPVQTSWLTSDFIEYDDPLYAGKPGGMAARGANFALQNCDLLISIGCRLDMVMTGYAHDRLARAAKKVMVDIDSAELAKMRTPIDLSIHANARDFLTEILRQSDSVESKNRSAWISRCNDWKKRYPIVLNEHRQQSPGVSTYYLTEVLNEELSADTTVVSGSSGTGIEIFLHAVKSRAGRQIVFTTGLGAMGFGIPAAVGACIATGRAETMCIDGDGGFVMNVQELETVARLNLPIKFFVLNNQGYASIRNSQRLYFGEDAVYGADATSGVTLPPLKNIACAFGLPFARISDQVNLHQQVRAVLDTAGPIVCEVMVPPEEQRAPRISTVQRPDGSMASRPLEDMWPFLDRAEFLENMIIPAIVE